MSTSIDPFSTPVKVTLEHQPPREPKLVKVNVEHQPPREPIQVKAWVEHQPPR